MVEYSDPRDFGFRPETVMTALMPYEQYSSKTRRLILGIDMGIASVGVCLIDIRNHEIILMASHIFKAPVEGKQKDISARQSGASIRRGYRSVRRTTKRRKNRKKAVREIEKKYSLIPDDADGQWFAIRKGEPDVLHLRGKALIYKLNGRELARILYAFAGRRGYIDHGKGTTDDDSGKVKKALSVNHKILDENGYETIAQYLLKQPTSRNREGDYRYMVDIEMVTDEVHTIFRHQRNLGSDIATEELEGEYLSALRWLTDTSARDEKIYSRVGYCTYLGAPEKRAASSLISFEMVRAYEKLSNIKIEHQGREATYISPEKRNEIVESLFAVSKNPKPLKWSQLREKLGMQSSDSFDSRLPADEKSDCIKIPAWNTLCTGLFTSNRALLDRFSYLKICDTPQVLLTAGFKQKPMLYTQNHLREALKPKSKNHPHRHGFSISEIKRWPELFKAPVILADNPSRDDALLVVLCAVDGDKLPLIASIKPDGKGHYEMDTVETNLVLTVFGKDNYMNYFQGALTPDKIVYIDKKQGQKLERLAERQLFGNYSSLDPNCIIHQPQCIYKLKEMEIVDRARSLTNKVLETRDSCESLASQRNVVEHDSHEERL